MNDHQAIAAGHRAFNELTELNAVFDKLERNTIERLRQTPVGPAHDAMILKLHIQLHTLAGVKQAMREIVDSGRIAEAAVAVAGLNKPV